MSVLSVPGSLAFALTLAALAGALVWESIRLRRRHGRPWLRDYTHYLTAFYLTAFANEVLPLLIYGLAGLHDIGMFLVLRLFYAIPLYIGAFFFFNRFIAGFSASKLPRGFAAIYFSGAGVFLAILIGWLIRAFRTGRLMEFWQKTDILSALPVFLVFCLSPVVLAFRARGPKERVRAVKAFLLAHTAGLALIGLIYLFVPVTAAPKFVRYVFNFPTLLILAHFAKRHLSPAEEIEGAEKAIEAGLSGFGITAREMDIIRLVCRGQSNREIAKELFITTQTVKHHLYKIFQKMNIRNRVQLANAVRQAAFAPGKKDVPDDLSSEA